MRTTIYLDHPSTVSSVPSYLHTLSSTHAPLIRSATCDCAVFCPPLVSTCVECCHCCCALLCSALLCFAHCVISLPLLITALLVRSPSCDDHH